MVKMVKKKADISFIDPITNQIKCTFNQCVNKFTIEDFEIFITPTGKEFISGFHKCNECGQKVKAKGDGRKAYLKWIDIQMAKDPNTLDDHTINKLYEAAIWLKGHS